MATTAITTFRQHVETDLMPCPRPLIDREILNVIIDFCDKTHVLTKEFNEEIDSDSIDTDLHNAYDVELTNYFSDVIPGIIISFQRDGMRYRPERKEILTDIPDDIWYDMANPEGAIYFSFPTDKILRVFDVQTTWTNLYVAMSVMPTRTSTTVDEMIYNHHLEAIVAGVKHKILSMPNKEWSDKFSARENYVEYRRRVSQAKARVMRRYSGWPMEGSPRSFHRIDWGV